MDIKNKKRKSEVEVVNSPKKNKSTNRKKSIMNSGKIVLGILASIGVGALIGIVFAPQKGAKTRRKIAKKGEAYLDDLKNQFDDFLSDASDKIDKINKSKDRFVSNEKEMLNDVKNNIKTAIL